MRDNVELQIVMINNKIERLKIQREFYEKILNKEDKKKKE